MLAKDIMTEPVTCCTPETSLQDVAKVMANRDCGGVPVIESEENPRLVGFVTDRDITCRTLAEGRNPLELKAKDAMSQGCFTAKLDTPEDELCRIMEEHQVRRIPIVDDAGRVVGIVAQADIAVRSADEHETFEIVRDISKPTQQI
ncbi:MAG: CBS domain-containing protein [Phycisphaeraceae bacterium]